MSEGVPHSVPQGAVCANHLDAQAVATCQRCGTFVCEACVVRGAAGTFCPACAPKVNRTPWEERSRIGWISAFGQTVQGTLLAPRRFFRLEPVDMGYGSAVLWAIVCSLIGGAFALAWGVVQAAIGLGLADQNPLLGTYLGAGGESLVLAFIQFLASPIIVVVAVLVMSGLTHLCLMMVGGAKRGFDTTFRTFAYCETTQLFAVVPLAGAFLAFFWNLVITINGLATAHETTVGKAAAAVLIPVGVLGLCAGGLILWMMLVIGQGFGPG